MNFNQLEEFFNYKRNVKYGGAASAAPKVNIVKPRRNKPCICGSGFKSKICCELNKKQKEIFDKLREIDKKEREKKLKEQGIVEL